MTNQINSLINDYISRRTGSGLPLSIAILKLAVNPNHLSLLNIYSNHVNQHNHAIMNDPFPNSGFDLFVPDQQGFPIPFQNVFVDHKVKAEMLHCDTTTRTLSQSAYYLYPRSSISKTPLILSNHVGIIDQGYRGNLIGAFRSTSENFVLDSQVRLLQVCHPTLSPILVILVGDEELSTTERNVGGFGSTGR
jgi:dUTP pyrophosphatase